MPNNRSILTSDKLAVIGADPATLPASQLFGLSDHHAELIRDIAKNATRENTNIAYDSDWSIWAAWAEAHGYPTFPASPAHVAAFLAHMATDGRRKLSTVSRYLATISAKHTRAGAEFNRGHTALRGVMDGLRQTADPRRRATPLSVEACRSLNDKLGAEGLRGIRDRAILLLGVASACRRSELVSLDWDRQGKGQGVLKRVPGGLELSLKRTKTKARDVPIADGLAVEAVLTWVAAAEIKSGAALFRAINRHGQISAERLTDRTVSEIVKARAAELGFDPSAFSGHSLRAGAITEGYLNDVAEADIQKTAGQTSNVTREYNRPGLRMDRALSKRIGL